MRIFITLKKLFNSTILCLIVFGACTFESQAAFENVGIGAKPMGMGGAYTALADDTTAILWNPAGLADVSIPQIGLSYLELYGLVGYSFIALAQPVASVGTIAASLSGSNDRDGNYQEVVLNISLARQVVSNLNLGINLKYLSSKASMGEIKVGSGVGLAADFGLRYDLSLRSKAGLKNKLRFGISLPNLFSYISYNREELKNAQASQYSESLLREYRLGLAASLDSIHKSLSGTSLSLEFANGNLLFGIEKKIKNAAVRTGYRFSGGLSNGITFGLGYSINEFELNYAYVNGKYDSQTSQFSLNLHY